MTNPNKCVGIPKESKPLEGRVALTPPAVADLIAMGCEVLVQKTAGEGSGYADTDYQSVGATMLDTVAQVFEGADIILKVKEPIGEEIDLLQKRHLLFCYLHLAANQDLMRRLQAIGLTAVAFETVVEQGSLPLLQPMSDIAGRLAIQVGTHLLHTPQGGKGILLGGVPGVDRGNVVILGAGNAGGNAARMAAALGARVQVFDRNPQRLAELQYLAPNISALYATAGDMHDAVLQADLVVGAVLLPGAAAPRLVSREEVGLMQPGSVIVDISVDQGGCIETTRPTTYDDPTYIDQGVLHFCVTNMPGAVPRSASQALTGALLPYLKRLLDNDWRECRSLHEGINVDAGEVVHPALLG